MHRRLPILSALCALVLSAIILALTPMDARAAEVIYSGTWGTCPWEITDDGVLTVHPGSIDDSYGLFSDQDLFWDLSRRITSIVIVEENGEKVVAPTDASRLFSHFDNVVEIDASGLDVSNVTDMSYMFYYCYSLTSLDVSGWDTSSVTNMESMFDVCSSLTSLDVSGWDTSSVTRMNGLFGGCSSLTALDLLNWDVSSLVTAEGLFGSCSSLTRLDLSSWDTYSCYDLGGMFSGCSSLTSLDVSGWNVSGVEIMGGMFEGCSSLSSLDLSGWDMASVRSMERMFNDCSSLETIYVRDDYRFNPFTLYDVMFEGCTSLVGGNGTRFDPDHVDGFYAAIDAPGDPGYFTAKNSPLSSTYTVSYNAAGGKGAPSPQTEKKGTDLTLSSAVPTKTYTISYDPNGGSVSQASKSVSCIFRGWNTERDGSGTSYAPGSSYTAGINATLYAQWTNIVVGGLETPIRDGYVFLGWYDSPSFNPVSSSRVTSSWIVTDNMTVYAHWAALGYSFGEETYSFRNYGDKDSPGGHCFGMAMTSSGYHNGLISISQIGGSGDTPLYGFSRTDIVEEPICHYQGIQGSFAARATVAGGSWWLENRFDIDSDWQEVVDYVKNHSYDNTGMLVIDFRKKSQGGHAINFLRYENVDGQDRLYAYDNNFPDQEVYFYRDVLGRVVETPEHTFYDGIESISGSLDSIRLIDIGAYFSVAGEFDATRAIYMAEDAAIVQGYAFSYISTDVTYDVEYVMYEIPSDIESVTIVPKKDNAEFTYMGTTYSFGEVTDGTCGELRLSTTDDEASSDEVFEIVEEPASAFFLDADPADDANHGAEVDWMGRSGISTGWEVAGGHEFRGLQTVKRCDFAAFLYRMADLSDDGLRNDSIALSSAQVARVLENVNDCTPSTDHAPEIAWLIQTGISKGWTNPDGTVSFKPYANVARQDMAAFLYRFADLDDDGIQNQSPEMGGQSVTFSDVRHGDDANHAAEVEWLASVGVTKGWDMGGGTFQFRGTNNVARQDMAAFMYRLYTYMQG